MLCLLGVFREVRTCGQGGLDPCQVGGGARLGGGGGGGGGGGSGRTGPRASTVAPSHPSLAKTIPLCGTKEGTLPVTGGYWKTLCGKKISCTDFESERLVIQYTGNWQEKKLLP